MPAPLRKLPADLERESDSWCTDPFRYGRRWRRVRLPSGEVTEQPVPLTPDDLLDPQLGDEVTQSILHSDFVNTLFDLLKRFFASEDDVLVLSDVQMLWGIPGLSNPAPDVAVIRGVRDKHDQTPQTFDVVEQGVRPCLVIEVVSFSDPEIRQNDYKKKVKIYQAAGIPEYVILEPPPLSGLDRFLITGYFLSSDGRYLQNEADDQGRLLSRTTGLLFGNGEDGDLVVIDVRTGGRLKTSLEVQEAWEEEIESRQAAEEEAARQAAARQAAEEEAARQAAARQAAEERAARAEAELARLQAELGKARKNDV